MVKELGVWGVGALGTRGLAVKLKQGREYSVTVAA